MNFNERVLELRSQTQALKAEILAFAQDKNNSLEQRWDAFRNYYALGGNKPHWIFSGWDNLPIFQVTNWKGETINVLSWNDDFDVERYETVDLIDCLDSLIECLADMDEEFSKALDLFYTSDMNYIEASLFVIKHPIVIQAVEALIDSGITHFTYDW